MNEPFVPLFPNPAPGTARGPEFSKARILSASTASQIQSVAPAPSSTPPQFVPTLCSDGARHSPDAASHANPTVTLQRDGEHISRIHIVCSCGQVIDLDCAY